MYASLIRVMRYFLYYFRGLVLKVLMSLFSLFELVLPKFLQKYEILFLNPFSPPLMFPSTSKINISQNKSNTQTIVFLKI